MNSSTPRQAPWPEFLCQFACVHPTHSLLHLSPRVLTSVLFTPRRDVNAAVAVETKSEPTDFWMLSAGLLS